MSKAYAYAFDAQGNCLEPHSGFESREIAEQAGWQANYPGCLVAVRDELFHPELAADHIRAVIVDGRITELQAVQDPEVWLHISVTGGDGQDPLGLANSGEHERDAQAAFSLRQTSEPTSALIPVNDSFRMRLRDKITGKPDYIKRVTLTGGQGSLNLRVPDGAPCGELELRESDFIPVMGYKVRLPQPFDLIIFEP